MRIRGRKIGHLYPDLSLLKPGLLYRTTTLLETFCIPSLVFKMRYVLVIKFVGRPDPTGSRPLVHKPETLFRSTILSVQNRDQF
jgi:hypothetical protein